MSGQNITELFERVSNVTQHRIDPAAPAAHEVTVAALQ